MSTEVDLRELAIERGGGAARVRTRRHLLTRYVLPLLLVGGFLALVAWASRDLVFPPQQVTVAPVISSAAEFRRAGAPLFKAAGWIEPGPTAVRVAALAPGVVENLLVVEDQPIEAGQPVAEMVKDDAQLALDGAQADVSLRQAELSEATAAHTAALTRYKQPVHLEAALGEAEAMLATIDTKLKQLPFEIRRAQADREAMRKDYQGKASAEGVVAGVEIDIAKSKAESAAALVEELQDRQQSLEKEQAALVQRRDALKTRLELLADEIQAKDAAAAQVQAATARLEQARVALAEAQLRLDRMTVRAPIGGRVYRLIADPGARIGSGMTQMQGHDGSTIVTLYRPDMLQVRVDVRFEDLPMISLHQPVEIDNPALASPLTGNVLFISSEADIQKNTLEVKVEIPDPPPVFKPEMLVDVTFLSQETKDEGQGTSDESQEARDDVATRIFVPQQLVQEGEGGSFVWLADRSAKVARKQPVHIGETIAGGLVEVTDGLTISSRLITSNIHELRDGLRIVVTGDDASYGGGSPAPRNENNSQLRRLPTGAEPSAP